MANNDYSVNGECVPEVCHSKCCTNILPLSDYEINRIKKYMKHHDIEPHNYNNLVENKYNDICPFLTEDYKCAVYVQRPEACRYYECTNHDYSRPFEHKDKKIINMLKTFDPDSSIPPDAPDVEQMDAYYQDSKKKIF